MHRLGRIVCLALLVGCAHRQPAELARTTPWATARDHGRYVAVNGLRVFAITLGGGRDACCSTATRRAPTAGGR